MDRRRFLALTAATLPTLRSFAQASSAHPATLVLHPDQPGSAVPTNFVGLSYETQQLSDPTFFAPGNAGLIAQFRALAPHGVLRIGGNTSDVGWWKPTPASPQPPLPTNVVVIPLSPQQRPFQELAFAITPQAVINLRGFLDATGWTCLYGINLGTSTPERAAEEAVFVAKILGPKLEYFQLGNEPDLFPDRFRVKATWSADAYLDEWLAAANAVRAAVPGARFGLPDTAGDPTWSSRIAERLSTLPPDCCPGNTPACGCAQAPFDPKRRPHLAAISHHYYFGGPPSNPAVNIDTLLRTKPTVLAVAQTTRAAAARLDTPYRMTEGNTCYRGGKPGVSDVFAAALWAADYLLQLASLGYAGVNLHGGDGQMVANSLGGTLPGELLMPNPKAPHARPFYTPIAHIGDQYVLEPVAYGMKFAQAFAGATMIPADFDPGPVNATLYAARRPNGQILLAFINKDTTQPLPLPTNNNSNWTPSLTLHAASLTSREAHLDTTLRTRQTAIPPATAMLFGQLDESRSSQL